MPKTQYADRAWMLEDAESSRLRAEDPTLWANPAETCLTCLKHTKPDRANTFRWYDETRENIVEWECDCLSQWIMNRYMLAAGIGIAYQRLDWMDAHGVPTHAVDTIWEYINEAPWFVSRGVNVMLNSEDNGTGKSMLAMLLGKAMLARGISTRVVQINTLVGLLSSTWKSEEQRRWFEAQIMNCAFLIIDDLGKEKGAADEATRDFIRRMLDRVVRWRVSNAMPTAWTSNLTDEQIKQGYGGDINDLLSEVCLRVEVNGKSFRPQMKERTLQEIRDRLCRPVVLA